MNLLRLPIFLVILGMVSCSATTSQKDIEKKEPEKKYLTALEAFGFNANYKENKLIIEYSVAKGYYLYLHYSYVNDTIFNSNCLWFGNFKTLERRGIGRHRVTWGKGTIECLTSTENKSKIKMVYQGGSIDGTPYPQLTRFLDL